MFNIEWTIPLRWLLVTVVLTFPQSNYKGNRNGLFICNTSPYQNYNIKNATNIQCTDRERYETYHMGILCPLRWLCITSVHDEHTLVLNSLFRVVLFFRSMPLNYLFATTEGYNVNWKSLLCMSVILIPFILSIRLCPNVTTRVSRSVISKTDCKPS